MPDRLSSRSLADLPADALARYGNELGLAVTSTTPRGELLRLVRARQELLLDLDREAMLDVIVWARRPVREAASKEQLAREIAQVSRMRFEGLSDAGLRTLAKLRDVDVREGDTRRDITQRLKKAEGLWRKVGRKSRRAVGSLIAQVIEKKAGEEAYRFLPEHKSAERLKEEIEEEGVVGGIARKLRGAADDYVHEKLDEIEARIDRKLDEIDHRLGEWRDREVTNRLRIIKVTLVASVLVALLSLGYDYFVRRVIREREDRSPAAPSRVFDAAPQSQPAPSGSRTTGHGGPAGTIMYEHLSKRMEEVNQLAHEIAREYEQEYVGTEHVLLAILREGTGIGAALLKGRGISEGRMKKEVDRLIHRAKEETWVFGRLPGSPHFKNVMAAAIEAARELKSPEVRSEHLLLGLLAEDGSVAHRALTNLGITPDGVRSDIIKFTPADDSKST